MTKPRKVSGMGRDRSPAVAERGIGGTGIGGVLTDATFSSVGGQGSASVDGTDDGARIRKPDASGVEKVGIRRNPRCLPPSVRSA